MDTEQQSIASCSILRFLSALVIAVILFSCNNQPSTNQITTDSTHTKTTAMTTNTNTDPDEAPPITYNKGGKAIVTLRNYARAESHYFMKGRADAGMFGRLYPEKKPIDADNQKVVRANADVLFVYSILDLTDPATITLPDGKGRFISMRVFNEDHYLKLLAYDPGDYVLTKEKMGTRYGHVAIRVMADFNDPKDMAVANALQDEIKLKQNSPGKFEVPDWDMKSLETVRKGIQMASSTLTNSNGLFGDVGEVDPVLHLSGVALGWGGAPERAAKYISVTPERNDGKTPYELTVGDVPVDAFWSIAIYNKDGYFEKNKLNLYSKSNVVAKKNADGTITIRMGGDPKADNYLPIFPGWNYTVRLYRPRKEILDGIYKFPEAKIVD